MTRSFRVLTSTDFEHLCADLLSAELGVRFERFADGRDGGVDVRASPESGLHIGQCKHYERSGFAKLLKSLKLECPKVEKLAPSEYWVLTTVDLSKTQKDQIFHLFQNHMSGPSRVLGAGDVAGLLAKHTGVERAHVKLWLDSGGVLQAMLDRAELARSSDLVERIFESLPRYVQSKAYHPARSVLTEHGTCILSGAPGVGKTTLAHILAAGFAEDGFELFDVSRDIDEAWSLMRPGVKQLFIYDDFLGRVAEGEHLVHREGERIANLIHKVGRSPDTKLLMTTREYLWASAIRSSEILDSIETRMKFVVKVEHLSRRHRAEILYSHLWHSDLDLDVKSQLLADQRYRRVIDHRNYSPRLVEAVTSRKVIEFSETVGDDYFDTVLGVLDRPVNIWRPAFEYHLTRQEQAILVSLLTQERTPSVEELEQAWIEFCRAAEVTRSVGDFRAGLSKLEGSFIAIRRNHGGGGLHVEFANPSVIDFLLSYVAEDRTTLEAMVGSVVDFRQLLLLRALGSRNEWFSSIDKRSESPALKAFRESIDRCAGAFSSAVIDLFPEDEEGLETNLASVATLPEQLLPGVEWFEGHVSRFFKRLLSGRSRLGASFFLLSSLATAEIGDRERTAEMANVLAARFEAEASDDQELLWYVELSRGFKLPLEPVKNRVVKRIESSQLSFDSGDPDSLPDFEILMECLEDLDLLESAAARDLHDLEWEARSALADAYEPDPDEELYRSDWEIELEDQHYSDLMAEDREIDQIFAGGLDH